MHEKIEKLAFANRISSKIALSTDQAVPGLDSSFCSDTLPSGYVLVLRGKDLFDVLYVPMTCMKK